MREDHLRECLTTSLLTEEGSETEGLQHRQVGLHLESGKESRRAEDETRLGMNDYGPAIGPLQMSVTDLGERGSRSVILTLNLTATRVERLVHTRDGGSRDGDIADVERLHQDRLRHQLAGRRGRERGENEYRATRGATRDSTAHAAYVAIFIDHAYMTLLVGGMI